MKEKILSASADLFGETVEMRRHLHRHPELSFHETATSAYVEERLAAMGITYKK